MTEQTPEGQLAPDVDPESQPAVAAVDPGWRRLHPLSPLLRGGLTMLVILGIVIANLRDRLLGIFIADEYLEMMGPGEGDLIDVLVEENLLWWALGAVLLAILAVVAVSWLSWRYASYRISPEAVESRRGVLFKQHRRAPLERIQSVNMRRTLLARMCGLTQLEVQTAGQDGKVELQYLGYREAKSVREQILLAAAVARGEVAAPAVPSLSSEDRQQLGSIDASGPGSFGHARLLDERLTDIADFDIDPTAQANGQLVKVPVGRLIGSIFLSEQVLWVVVIGAAMIVAAFTFSPFMLGIGVPLALAFIGMVIGQFNKGFHFTLSRAADGVRVGAGLSSTITETVPLGRVHAIEARQPLGWRPFGWWQVRITTAGHALTQAGQNRLQNMVLPVGGLNDVLRVVETLRPLDGDPATRDQALTADLIGDGAGFLRAGPRSAWVLWFGRKRAGLRLAGLDGTHATLRIRRGFLTRSLSILPLARAQSVELSRPLLHRALGLTKLQAHTVLGPIQVQMRGLALRDGRQAFDVLAASLVRAQQNEHDE